MDLGTLIRILIKRWLIVLPIVAITLVAAIQLGRSIDPDFQARGSVLLIGPNIAGGDAVNPLAELRSPLNTTALAIAIITGDGQTRDEVRQLGFEGTYQVDVTPSTPILNIRVRASTPEQALLTLEAVIEAVVLTLDERQRGVEAPENSLIQGETLTKTTTARALYGSRDRAVAVIMALGMVAAASAAVLLDAYASRSALTLETDEVDVDRRSGSARLAPAADHVEDSTTRRESAKARRAQKKRARAARKSVAKRAKATRKEIDAADKPNRRERRKARKQRRKAKKQRRMTADKSRQDRRKAKTLEKDADGLAKEHKTGSAAGAKVEPFAVTDRSEGATAEGM